MCLQQLPQLPQLQQLPIPLLPSSATTLKTDCKLQLLALVRRTQRARGDCPPLLQDEEAWPITAMMMTMTMASMASICKVPAKPLQVVLAQAPVLPIQPRMLMRLHLPRRLRQVHRRTPHRLLGLEGVAVVAVVSSLLEA